MSDTELKFPFARELEEQHDAMRAAMRWLQAEVGPERKGPPCSPREARALLHPFREQLVLHFRFEERNGFQGGFASDDPEVQRWTQELVRQHHEFEQRLGALVGRLDRIGDGAKITDDWLVELQALLRALRRHDAEENAVLLWISRGPADFAGDLEPD